MNVVTVERMEGGHVEGLNTEYQRKENDAEKMNEKNIEKRRKEKDAEKKNENDAEKKNETKKEKSVENKNEKKCAEMKIEKMKEKRRRAKKEFEVTTDLMQDVRICYLLLLDTGERDLFGGGGDWEDWCRSMKWEKDEAGRRLPCRIRGFCGMSEWNGYGILRKESREVRTFRMNIEKTSRMGVN